ncbi:MAG: hypothetical protein ISS36_01920 [Candidatus Aenigmarchaeota archaeon]|nr:hypothetical protein [Candidatus Aenigmarchaeota archaeon]
MEIKDEKFVSWSEVKTILDKRAEEKALGYEQKNASEHLKKFSKLTTTGVKEIAKELSEIAKLKERHISIITNLAPQDDEDLRVLFANEIINLTPDDKRKILSIVKKHS